MGLLQQLDGRRWVILNVERRASWRWRVEGGGGQCVCVWKRSKVVVVNGIRKGVGEVKEKEGGFFVGIVVKYLWSL